MFKRIKDYKDTHNTNERPMQHKFTCCQEVIDLYFTRDDEKRVLTQFFEKIPLDESPTDSLFDL